MNSVTETAEKRKPLIYKSTILWMAVFFALTFYFRNYLDIQSLPFTMVFWGIALFVFLSGRFETYILILLITTSTVFDLFEFPVISIGVGDLFFSDVLIITLLLGRLLKRVTVQVTVFPKPMGYLVLTVILTGFFAFFYAVVGFGTSITSAGIELRTIVYYSMFFLVYYYMKNDRQLRTVLLGMGLLTAAVAFLLIVQGAMGYENDIIGGRVEILNTAGQKYTEVSRVLAPGSSLVISGLITLITIYILRGIQGRKRPLILWMIALVTAGLIFTFTRSYWIIVVFSLMVLLFIERRRFSTYPRLTLVVIGALTGGALLLQTKAINSKILEEAVFERSLSIFKAPRNFRNDTLYMRYLESRYAWNKIKQYPLLGIGLGTKYRQNIFGNTDYERNVGGKMVHSGYLATQLKMGIPGTLAMLTMVLVFLWRCFHRYRKVKDPLYKAVVLGIAVNMIGMIVLNVGPSPFMTISWVPVVAVCMGLVEKIFQLEGLA